MSIQSKLKARAAQHALEAEKTRQQEARWRKLQAHKLEEAVKKIGDLISDFEVQRIDRLTFKVTIPYARRSIHTQPDIFVTVNWETRQVQYADDMRPESKQCLEVKAGWAIYSTSFICGPDQFEESFIKFIEQNYVVT